MDIAILLIVVLVGSLFFINKVNAMYSKPTAEELENYQESVFLHIDEEIENYKKDIGNIAEEAVTPYIDKVNESISLLDRKIVEYTEIEKRIDEKTEKLEELKRLINKR